MKTALFGMAGAVAVLAVACGSSGARMYVDSPDCESIARQVGEQHLPVLQLGLQTGGDVLLLDAEVAADQPTRARGLMCRSQVLAGTGMLFQFPAPAAGPFWMFNTYVPLDIIYFDASGSAVGSATMTPCPREAGEADADWQSRCLRNAAGYGPDDAYTAALEVPSGWLLEQGMGVESLPGDLKLAEFGPVSR